jgi:predicted DNA-binding WGR domain protein
MSNATQKEHYLEMNDSSTDKGTHHKFYRMRLAGEFVLITYGRIGSKGKSIVKPNYEYDSILTSKLRKGYQDKTEGFKLMQEFHLITCTGELL